MRNWRPFVFLILLGVTVFSWILFQLSSIHTSANTHAQNTQTAIRSTIPGKLQLDSRLPEQTFNASSSSNNVNAKFGSRFDFVVSPSTHLVSSGTDGLFHDNTASYIVGIAPTDSHTTSLFHMGTLNGSTGDTYVSNEKWTQGLDTSRWEGDASDGSGMHITVDIIDTFYGEPGCIAIADCASAVQDDTVPVFLVGVTLQNSSNNSLSGNFLFGSNRSLSLSNPCTQHTTPGGTPVTVLSYSNNSDVTGGTLFLAGAQSHWQCNTGVADRAGLAWNYSIAAAQSQTNYMLIGGWNTGQNLFMNTQLPAGCQQEQLYPALEWSTESDVVNFAIDNLSARDNLLGRVQSMENTLIENTSLTTQQRWIIADTMRSYKAASWLVGRQSCAGGGYDAAVYEGTFGFLTTVDVLHDYGYFEINRVPWFFKSALLIVFKNALHNNFGLFFQHDQGGDVNSDGICTGPGQGIPTIRATCYAPPRFSFGSPMPTEEDSNVALLTAYYVYITGDTSLLTDNNNANLNLIDASMQHNQRVGDPATGIAYNSQDTNTTYDDQKDCLHNLAPNAGNLYYQGLKEATAYRAAAFIDNLIPGDNNAPTWQNEAGKIENAMVQEYNANGFIPLAQNTGAYNNCNGRTVTTGEGLFYLHLIGQDTAMNQVLLQDLAHQYPADVSANTLTNPQMISLESTPSTGPQCPHNNVCYRYEWFSKVMLSGLVADFIYTQHGCTACHHLEVTDAVFKHNIALPENFGDGLLDNGSDWPGHYYPRGIISWAFLDAGY